MSPGVLGAESDTWSSSRSSLRCWDPPIPHAERGAHERPRLALSSVGLLQHAHARTLSLPALTGSPRRAAPLHRHPAKPRTRQTPPTLPDFALARIPAAHLARSIPIAGVRGDRRRAASFNAPFSRIALPRDDTKKPSSFSDTGRPGARCHSKYKHGDTPEKGRFSAELGGFGQAYHARYWHEREFETVA